MITLFLLFFGFGLTTQAQEEEIKEPNRFLLLGLAVNPAISSLKNAWVIGEGRDYFIFDSWMIGYETGLAHRYYDDRSEYGFKTFFNTKYTLLRPGQTAIYLGVGAGLFETLQIMELESKFNFDFGVQGILGFTFGAPGADKFCFEAQVIKTSSDDQGFKIHILAGVRF